MTLITLEIWATQKDFFFLQEFSFKILTLRQCQHREIILNT